MKSYRLTWFILLGLILGIGAGYFCRSLAPDEASIKAFAYNISILTDIFLRLIKMIIAPLVVSTLIVGIAKMGDAKTVGRVGGKTMLWFIFASFVSLALGLVMVNILKPGVGLDLSLPAVDVTIGVKTSALTFKEFITNAIPSSAFQALAKNEILQIVVFAVFFGCGLAALGEWAKPLITVIDIVAQVMLKVTGYVMLFAPFAVFGAIAATVAEQGLGVLVVYGEFMLGFYITMLVLWLLIVMAGFSFVGRPIFTLLKRLREPLVLAFTTASSEAAYPRTLYQLERFGCSNKIASFVLPIGYSFNLDGSMMYCTFAAMFIAQAYGIELTIMQQITLLLILMITSKGIAGVPRASLVVIAATLSHFHIPEAGLLLLLGIDHFLDMGRSATNVVGNSIAAAVVSKWENELDLSGESENTTTV